MPALSFFLRFLFLWGDTRYFYAFSYFFFATAFAAFRLSDVSLA